MFSSLIPLFSSVFKQVLFRLSRLYNCFRSQEVIIGPENRTATANDNFLKVNLIGDFAGYTNIPSFEDFYLAIPREV